MVTVESLLEQAKSLPESDRGELARRLYDTLTPIPEMPPEWANDEEAEAAWQEELQRRLDSIADGSAQLIDTDQMFADIKAYREDKRPK
ncbi:MAG TPA: addiction module protein [Gemmataceae bacterium]|nr:addiction module protein [Gemmataceae bacterium]